MYITVVTNRAWIPLLGASWILEQEPASPFLDFDLSKAGAICGDASW